MTKDVPPYAIVAGNPARIVKYRFKEEEIKALLEIGWWHWDSDTLKKRYREMMMPVLDFVECFRQEALKKKIEMLTHGNPVNKNVSGSIYACIADMEETFPVCPKIIDEFCRKFQEMDGQLVIYVFDSKNKESVFEKIVDRLLPYEKVDCSIQIIDGGSVPLADVIRFCDVYITNRLSVNLEAVEQAYFFHKKVLSGVDIPIWKA